MDLRYRENKITIIICGINVIVFLGLMIFGMTEDAAYMLSKGALYAPYVVENGEYYRLFTSLFMHFGIEHLGNNMILLFVMGTQLEKELGAVKFAILYFVAGLGGNVLSLWADIVQEQNVVSAGASGAVYGLIGGCLWVAIRNKGTIGNLSSNGILIVIAMGLYFGLTSTGIDNLAHIGGLVMGFVMAILLYRNRHSKNSPFFYN